MPKNNAIDDWNLDHEYTSLQKSHTLYYNVHLSIAWVQEATNATDCVANFCLID